MSSQRVFIGIGSNLEPEQHIRSAVRLLCKQMRLQAISTVYRNQAEGRPEQPLFYNLVVAAETELSPAELRRALREIEDTLGRVRTEDKYAARTIDLDILIYGGLVVASEEIVIPDPAITRRPYLAVPLAELVPGLILSGDSRRLAEIAAALMPHGMTPLPEFTRALKGDIARENTERVAELIRELLIEIGEDPNREGLLKTPERVAHAYQFLTSGYHVEPEQLVNGAIFTQETNNMVIARDIELYSLCEHHMLPFFGRCHIGYISSKGRIFGVSKLARVVDMYARRLQIQERLTEQIAHAIEEAIQADGVGVVIEAQHLCMMMRGVEKQNSMMTTSSVLGSFRASVATRNEFLTLIGRQRS